MHRYWLLHNILYTQCFQVKTSLKGVFHIALSLSLLTEVFEKIQGAIERRNESNMPAMEKRRSEDEEVAHHPRYRTWLRRATLLKGSQE